MVISYIKPTDDELQPPGEIQSEDSMSLLVKYDSKYYQTRACDGDGLCLFYSFLNFLTSNNYLPKSLGNFNDSASFLKSGKVDKIEDYIDKLSVEDLKLIAECKRMDDDIKEGAKKWTPKKLDMNHANDNWVIRFMTEITKGFTYQDM